MGLHHPQRCLDFGPRDVRSVSCFRRMPLVPSLAVHLTPSQIYSLKASSTKNTNTRPERSHTQDHVDKQCKYNVTMRRTRVILLLCQRNWYCIFLCAWVSACVCVDNNARARMYPCLSSMQIVCAILRHLWPPWLYQIFRHYLINGTILWKSYWI